MSEIGKYQEALDELNNSSDHPTAFGMHSNADITFRTKQCNEMAKMTSEHEKLSEEGKLAQQQHDKLVKDLQSQLSTARLNARQKEVEFEERAAIVRKEQAQALSKYNEIAAHRDQLKREIDIEKREKDHLRVRAEQAEHLEQCVKSEPIDKFVSKKAVKGTGTKNLDISLDAVRDNKRKFNQDTRHAHQPSKKQKNRDHPPGKNHRVSYNVKRETIPNALKRIIGRANG